MNTDTAIAVMMIGIVLSIAIGTGLGSFADANVAVEAAKAGLQQCPTRNGLAWQKACTK